jgi:hypothetical protein
MDGGTPGAVNRVRCSLCHSVATRCIHRPASAIGGRSILKNEPDIGAHGSAPKDPWFHNYLIFKRTGTVGTEQSPHGPYLPTSCDERVLARIQFSREGGP